MAKSAGTVSVTIVTYNSSEFIARCLDSVLGQNWPSVEVIVVDNASQDNTLEVLARYRNRLRLIVNSNNSGFAAAQNQAIRQASGDWVLALNPDVRLTPHFISCLMEGSTLGPDMGTVCGKLLRATPSLDIPEEARVDSAGIYFTPTFRHLDRGSNQLDSAAYSQPALVFGATAAAALYRKSMIQDVSVDGEFFDEDFFLYREDADVSWRAQLLGWRCLYVPEAVGYHVRTVFPECRDSLPPEINRQCVQNRFLMRIKNATFSLYLRHFLPVTVRDMGVLFYCLLTERSSLSAFSSVGRLWRRMLEKRRIIQQRRKVSDKYIESWFGFRPVTRPVQIPRQTLGRSPAGSRAAISVPATGGGQFRPL